MSCQRFNGDLESGTGGYGDEPDEGGVVPTSSGVGMP
jgi:hypothetical protein